MEPLHKKRLYSAFPACVISVHPDKIVHTAQKLQYFVGLSAETVGMQALSMHIVVIPAGASSEPHLHEGYETAIYILEGMVLTRYGEGLSQSVVSEAGDFLFIPPGVPHQAVNLNQVKAARAIVARNDASGIERVTLYQVTSQDSQGKIHA